MDNNNKSAQTVAFDPGTEELLKKISDENITIHPVVWDILTHVIGNRAYAIILILGELSDMPKWIIKASSCVMIFLYKVSGGKGNLHTVPYYLERIQRNTTLLKEFIDRLREATKEKREF